MDCAPTHIQIKTDHKKILAEDFLSEDGGKKQQQELKIIVVFDSNKNKLSKYKNYDRHHKNGNLF